MFLILAFILLLPEVIVLASGPGSQNVQMSGAEFGFISTNTYVSLSSTTYFDKANITSSMVYLINASTQPSGVSPTYSFGFGSPNANLTLISINSNYIDFGVSPSNQLMNMTFYYGYIGFVPVAVQVGSQVINFPSYSSQNCAANCVVLNTASKTITVVADPSSILIFTSEQYTATIGDCGGSNYWDIPFTTSPQMLNYTGNGVTINYTVEPSGNWVFNYFPSDNVVFIWNGSQGPGTAGHFQITGSSYSWTPPSGIPVGSEIEILIKKPCGTGNLPFNPPSNPITGNTNTFVPLVFGAYGRFLGGNAEFVMAFLLAAFAGIYAKTRSAGIITVLFLIVLPPLSFIVPSEIRYVLYVFLILGASAIFYQLYRRSSIQ